LTNSSSLDCLDSNSEILELESIIRSRGDAIEPKAELLTILPQEPEQKVKTTTITQSITIPSTGEKFGVKAELDSILTSLRLPTPHPPEGDSISDILAKIAAAEPMARNQQLLQELHTANEQLNLSQIELQSLHQRNQAQVEAIDASVLQVKELKFRTQQLARHSKNQIQTVQEMLGSEAQIRQEIATGLEKFGGYEEIHSMLAQLEATRHALVIAHDRLRTGQEAFYESLRAIQEQVAFQSHDSEHKLRQYQESIQSLMETISADRLQIGGMGVQIGLKFTELDGFNSQITTIHGQIVEKSASLQVRIAEIEGSFAELSQSVQMEKEQFYALTAETIDRSDGMRSQFADLLKQIGVDRDAIEQIQSEVKLLRNTLQAETESQLEQFDRQYRELMSNWSELQIRQKTLFRHTKRFSTWLWILSCAVGVIFLLLITVLLRLK
jgi:chromosome segregation ATPase